MSSGFVDSAKIYRFVKISDFYLLSVGQLIADFLRILNLRR